MQKRHFERMAAMVKDILGGNWTHEPPAWSNRDRYLCVDTGEPDYIRAVQTAEAFILLCEGWNPRFDCERFLMACGLANKPVKALKRTVRKEPVCSICRQPGNHNHPCE